MKKLILSLMALAAVVAWQTGCASSSSSTESHAKLPWGTDIKQAQATAQSTGHPVLLDFTGSDWCGWCIKMHKDVLDTPKFADYAKANLVLMEVDFPQQKPQTEALKKSNEALQEKYKIEGFPTYVLLSGEGKEIWRHEGYLEGGPEAFIAEVEKAKK